MKWKTNPTILKNGDRRTKIKFALFPIETDDGYTVWLETYESNQQFCQLRCACGQNPWKEVNKLALFYYPI